MEDLFEPNKSLLKSTLLDEGKLLTYVSISKDLCVHVNISKLMLQRLVEHVRQENADHQLNVCYIISGATDNNNARTIVCSEQDLNKEKECFKNIFFEHIYSVTKGSPSMDTAAYLNVNKFEDFALCSGLIKSKQCDKRTMDEIGNLKSNSQEVIVPEKSKSLPISVKKIKKEINSSNNGKNELRILSKPDVESKSEPVIKQETISPKKENVQPVNNSKPKIGLTNGQKAQKGIAGFFNKTNSINKKEVKDKLLNDNGTETKQKIETKDVKTEKMKVEEAVPIVPVKVEDKKESSNKILNQIKRTSKVDKKRKRVLHVSDSESDNENNDPFVDESVQERDLVTHDSEDEIPPTPTVSNVVIKSGITNPKKRRKVVDKTYTDEEGYILTKKVEVYESCSENEEEATAAQKNTEVKEVKNEPTIKNDSPKKKPTATKKKVSPPQKGKQATLTNFFKKL